MWFCLDIIDVVSLFPIHSDQKILVRLYIFHLKKFVYTGIEPMTSCTRDPCSAHLATATYEKHMKVHTRTGYQLPDISCKHSPHYIAGVLEHLECGTNTVCDVIRKNCQ